MAVGSKTKSLWEDPSYRRKQARARRLRKAKLLGYEAAKKGIETDPAKLLKVVIVRETRGTASNHAYRPRIVQKGNEVWAALEREDREWKEKLMSKP